MPGPIEFSAPITAIAYREGHYPEAFFQHLRTVLADRGLVLGGIIQHDTKRIDRSRCDMALEDLFSGQTFLLSEDRGAGARGCRMDQSVLMQACAAVTSALEDGTIDALVINKFGKAECEGSGLRSAIAEAVGRGVPVVVGVPTRNLDAFNVFAADMAIVIHAEDVLHGAGLFDLSRLLNPPLPPVQNA